MKCELIHSCGSDRLILIFAGWSTSADFYKDVAVDGYDVMVASDYSDMDFPKDMLRGYSIVCLFAWSLGVFAASRSLPFERIARPWPSMGRNAPWMTVTESRKGFSRGLRMALTNGIS